MSQLGAWAAGAFRQNMENKPPLWDIARKGDIDTTPGRRHTHRAGGGDKRVHIYGEQKHTPPHTPRATPRAHPRRYTNAARASYTCLDSPKPVQMQRGIPRATLRASHARSRGTSASRRSVLLQHVTAPTVPREGQPKIGRVRLPVRGY